MITLEQWCKDNKQDKVLQEWDWNNNHGITPNSVSYGSHKHVNWICSVCGYSWETEVRIRTIQGHGCRKCANKNTGVKLKGPRRCEESVSLAKMNPELMKEWNFAKNEGIDPKHILPQTHMDVYWICSMGHEFRARIQNRVMGSKCPFCSGKKPIKGETDLQTTNPEILDEWDYSRNKVLPEDVSAGTEKKVFWIGKCGHTYKQMVINHVKGYGCPVCAGKIVIPGDNDLETKYPAIVQEWNYEKNKILPSQITPHSTKKVWWKCKNGHDFYMGVGERTGNGRQGCPICAKESKTSFPEQAIFYYIAKCYPDAVSGEKCFGRELDIYIPSIKTAIEYDGSYWHGNKRSLKKDNSKDLFCKKKGIRLIRFRDEGLPDTNLAERITCKDGSDSSLQEAIIMLFDLLGSRCPKVSISKDSSRIMSSYVVNRKKNSLLNMFPEIAKEWHPTKNGTIKPDMVAWGSAKSVWWKCSLCGTEWNCKICTRTSEQKQGCPSCTMKEVKRNNSSPVRNIDTGEVFDSITQAAVSCNGRIGDISTVCRGQQKTAFGFRWEYVNGKSVRNAKKYKGKVLNIDNHMVFDSLAAAAKWCDGKVLNISACCRGRQKTAYGYHWQFMEETVS